MSQSNDQANNQGIFINGKNQMVEMLQFLDQEERQKLIANIYRMNPAVAKELNEKSLGFEDVYSFSDSSLAVTFKYVKPQVWGLALKNTPREFQRKVLSLMPRQLAEQAYEIFSRPMANEIKDSRRAQKKIVEVVISLSRKKAIDI